jgi:hypothetical protein
MELPSYVTGYGRGTDRARVTSRSVICREGDWLDDFVGNSIEAIHRGSVIAPPGNDHAILLDGLASSCSGQVVPVVSRELC